MDFTQQQLDALDHARRHHPVPHLRTKAIALWNVGRGRSYAEVGEFVGVERHTIGNWVTGFLDGGLESLRVKPGRGRKSQVDEQDVRRHVLQSPRNFGHDTERWTLQLLHDTVPSLRHLRSLRSVRYVLERLGVSWKRGQFQHWSPDPDYEKKKRRS